MKASYFLGLLFVFAWWAMAFFPLSPPLFVSPDLEIEAYNTKVLPPFSYLLLKKSLAGSPHAMQQFYQYMVSNLSAYRSDYPDDCQDFFNQGKELLHLLKEKSTPLHNKPLMVAQSYSSGVLLLSIAPLAKILSIPQGLRYFSNYLPDKDLSSIPHNTETLSAKTLNHKPVQRVFIASYSLPKSLLKYKKLNIPLSLLPDVRNLEDIHKNLHTIGKLAHCEKEAKQLSLFMSLCQKFLKIKLQYLKKSKLPIGLQHSLILHHYHHFSLSGTYSLNYEMLRFFSMEPLQQQLLYPSDSWSKKISKDKILNHAPQYLLIVSPNAPELIRAMQADIPFSQLPALKNSRYLVLDEACSNNPTPFILINYFLLMEFLESQNLSTVL